MNLSRNLKPCKRPGFASDVVLAGCPDVAVAEEVGGGVDAGVLGDQAAVLFAEGVERMVFTRDKLGAEPGGGLVEDPPAAVGTVGGAGFRLVVALDYVQTGGGLLPSLQGRRQVFRQVDLPGAAHALDATVGGALDHQGVPGEVDMPPLQAVEFAAPQTGHRTQKDDPVHLRTVGDLEGGRFLGNAGQGSGASGQWAEQVIVGGSQHFLRIDAADVPVVPLFEGLEFGERILNHREAGVVVVLQHGGREQARGVSGDRIGRGLGPLYGLGRVAGGLDVGRLPKPELVGREGGEGEGVDQFPPFEVPSLGVIVPGSSPLHLGNIGGDLPQAPLVVPKGGGTNVNGALVGDAEQIAQGRVRLLFGLLGFGFVLFEGCLPACLQQHAVKVARLGRGGFAIARAEIHGLPPAGPGHLDAPAGSSAFLARQSVRIAEEPRLPVAGVQFTPLGNLGHFLDTFLVLDWVVLSASARSNRSFWSQRTKFRSKADGFYFVSKLEEAAKSWLVRLVEPRV